MPGDVDIVCLYCTALSD